MSTVANGRKRPLPLARVRIILNVNPDLAKQVRQLATRERRPLSTQVEILIEHGLRTMEIGRRDEAVA